MLWANGDALGATLREILRQLGGEPATQALDAASGAVWGVAYGVFGTALIQAVVMALELMLARVPGAAVLGFAAAGPQPDQRAAHRRRWLRCRVVVVPPWRGGLGHLHGRLDPARAFGDNVIRPGLIGFGVAMPLSLVILGVFGGFLSFGFLGLFIGPTPLGVGLALLKAWREAAPPL